MCQEWDATNNLDTGLICQPWIEKIKRRNYWWNIILIQILEKPAHLLGVAMDLDNKQGVPQGTGQDGRCPYLNLLYWRAC